MREREGKREPAAKDGRGGEKSHQSCIHRFPLNFNALTHSLFCSSVAADKGRLSWCAEKDSLWHHLDTARTLSLSLSLSLSHTHTHTQRTCSLSSSHTNMHAFSRAHSHTHAHSLTHRNTHYALPENVVRGMLGALVCCLFAAAAAASRERWNTTNLEKANKQTTTKITSNNKKPIFFSPFGGRLYFFVLCDQLHKKWPKFFNITKSDLYFMRKSHWYKYLCQIIFNTLKAMLFNTLNIFGLVKISSLLSVQEDRSHRWEARTKTRLIWSAQDFQDGLQNDCDVFTAGLVRRSCHSGPTSSTADLDATAAAPHPANHQHVHVLSSGWGNLY